MSTSKTLTVGAVQCALGDDLRTNVDRVERLVREAADAGARVVLPPELFEGPYFPQREDEAFFDLARPVEDHPTIERFRRVAAECSIVVPVSFFERSGQAHYNSLAMIDADGTVLGVYRKSHIPDGPGYSEKFYFRPGDTGFKVFKTRFGVLGAGICWDQWYPECARAMALMGAELLLYPTAIGSEPHDPSLDTKDPWQRVMAGHAVANVMPVVAANRIGQEGEMTFYGGSFLADPRGDRVAELGPDETGVITHAFDLDAIRRQRNGWGFFRDRRPELYDRLGDA